MRLVSWNVNGIRACRGKGFDSFLTAVGADMLCLQEVKATQAQAGLEDIAAGYHIYWHPADKPGYSGTATLTRQKPISVSTDMEGHTGEGRILTLEYETFYLVNTYVPNSQRELARLGYRMEWQEAFKQYARGLDERKPVIICGDLNVAHQDIDIARPKANRRNAGFTDEERQKMTELLDAGFIDTFRTLYPDEKGAYTWWSYMASAREKNIGWRIDYFLASQRLKPDLQDAKIYPEIHGSDHCPVQITVNR